MASFRFQTYIADRNYDVCNALSYRCRKREDSNRKTDSEYNSICYARGRETVRIGMPWRIMYRRGRCSKGIPEQTGTDKGTIHREPLYVPGERIYRTGDLVTLAAG